MGRLGLDDLNWERRTYRSWGAYAQSKLANLMFAYELQRRLEQAGSPLRSLAAHPGYASTELQSHTETALDRVMAVGNRLVAQSADMGALPELHAATVPDVPGGSYIGPGGPLELWGHPRPVRSSRAARDADVGARLWELSEELTGIRYP